MKRRGKLLFWAGVICVMGGLLFVGLFEFTPLRQGLQDRLVLDSLEEFEYRILSVQKDENGQQPIMGLDKHGKRTKHQYRP